MKRLPVVPGMSCDRRQLLLQMGLGALLAGCRLSLEDDPVAGGGGGGGGGGGDPGPDAGGVPTDAGTTAFTLDLSLEENAPLRAPGGSLVVTLSRRVIVVRVSETEVVALAAACTHQGRTLMYRPTEMDLYCNNHFSEFALDGSVERGPAVRELASYEAVYDATAQTITVTI